MKQEAKKQSKKWIWLIAGLAALLVILAVVLAIFLTPGQQEKPSADAVELYWNVDRVTYTENAEVEGISTREPAADGLYYVRFAVRGEQKELPVADKQLVNYIDSMNLMGLVFDSEGTVTDAVDPTAVATELAKDWYVCAVDGNTVTINSSVAMNGMEKKLGLSTLDIVYDVDPDAQVVGAVAQPQIMDRVTVYSDAQETVTHVYITERAEDAEVYWRVQRCYDAATGQTTRVPDENGVYTILFAKDGEQVELKCRDVSIVNEIDGRALLNGEVALQFDKEGYIVNVVDVSIALRGKLYAQDYHVTAIDGNTVTATRLSGSEAGKIVKFTLDDACDIFMCCEGCYDSHIGEHTTQMRLEDRFHLYTDLEGKPIVIFVTRRSVDSPMYFSLERKYSSTTKETTRVPDASGYYVFEMVADGKQVTVRTKDKALATAIDARSDQCVGLKLNGNIVEAVYISRCVSGGGSLGTNMFVTTLMGTVFSQAYATNMSDIASGVLAPDCKIYDVTGFCGVAPGTETTLKLYDRATCFKNIYGEVTAVFVTERYVEGTKIYYSTKRMYDAANQTTTREPDAEGYYVFDMICDGKAVTLKTKNKELASFVDKQNGPFIAMKVSGDTIKEAYPVNSALQYGRKVANYNYVEKINSDGTFTTYYYSGDEIKYNSVVPKITKNTKIYNVSSCIEEYLGEQTTLQVGDRVQAVATYPDNECAVIFVLERKIDSPLYWNMERKYNSTTQETTRVPDAEGWYVFDLAVNGSVKQYKTKDKTIASEVDSYDAAFALETKGDVILSVYAPAAAKGISSTTSYYDVMAIDGNTLSLTRNQPNASTYGKTTTVTLSEDCVFYDVSPYAEDPGAKTTLGLGDRVVCYGETSKKVTVCFIVYKHTRQEGYVSYCDHCDQEVFWNPYTSVYAARDAHYYLTHDGVFSSQYSVGKATEQYDVVLDLNGHTMTAETRAFLVYGTLTVIDTVGGGGITAQNQKDYNGGCILVYGSGTLNLYDGVLTVAQDGGTAATGGVIYVGSDATFHMYGGTITGGTASGRGGNVATAGGTFTMSGGTIDGDVAIAANTKVTLSGDCVITRGEVTGLQLPEGVKLTLGALTDKASIRISANGVFTEASEKAAQYAACFVPMKKEDKILVQDSALYYEYNDKDLNSIDNSDLVFDAGTTRAYCPVCDTKVTWKALESTDVMVELTNGDHYYLSGDVTYTGADCFLRAPSTGGTACVHLNGHNITATGARAILGYPGVLNVMGNGTVSGNHDESATSNVVFGSTVAINTNGAAGTVNLAGGTYVAPESNPQQSVVSINNNGGKINLYNGATIEAGSKPYSVYVGTANLVDGSFTVYGGSISSGMVYISGANEEKGNSTGFTMSGGTLGKGVQLSANSSAVLSGAPVIGGKGIRVPEGVMLTLGALTDGADITVSASGVFTEENENTSAYAQYFTTANVNDKIDLWQNRLVYTKVEKDLNTVDNSRLVFASGTTEAVCPVCGELVTWTALSSESAVTAADGGHYYLTADVTYTGTDVAFITAPGSGGTACVHLNGYSITATAHRAIDGNTGELNVMGSGTVSGSFNANLYGATVHTQTGGRGGSINLIGGTYTKPASSNQSPIVMLRNGGDVNMYAGAQIIGVDDGAKIANVRACADSFSMFGGKLSGGEGNQVQTGNWNDKLTGIFTMSAGEVNGNVSIGGADVKRGGCTVTGGTITGTLTLSVYTDNTVSGGNIAAVHIGSNVTNETASLMLTGTPVIGKLNLPAGFLVKLGELKSGAAIVVSADGVFTEASEKAADYAGHFTSANQLTKIGVKGNALYCQKDYLSDLAFEAGTTKALCPACEEVVQWKALSGSTAISFADGDHYYLEEDVTYTGKQNNGFLTAPGSNKTACLHLNGNNLTATTHRVIFGGGGVLNVMGSGIVSGNITDTNHGAAVHFNTSAPNGTINLYGGTYTKPATNTTAACVTIWSNGGGINLYEGASIVGNGSGNSVYIGQANLRNASFCMYGGVIEGGDVRIVGANPAKGFTCSFTMSGGSIRSTVEVGTNTEFTLSGASQIQKLVLADGLKITLGEMTDGAAVTVSASGVFTEVNEKAADLAAYFTAVDGYQITVGENVLSCDKTAG